MRIACLQFAPQLGDVDNNMNRADAVLNRANPQDLDLLVLPEMAFTGYNFKSLEHISPYLEPSTSGITSLWARTMALKYECFVTVGYPEKVDIRRNWPTSPEYYNSIITVNPDGETVANYRKAFLYQTDETWALEGPEGFYDGEIEGLGDVAMGICMDINPYKFEAAWNAWEFAFHVLHREVNLVILSMAWITRENPRAYSRVPREPDMQTLSYWLARMEPVIRDEGEDEIIFVFANRCGSEEEVTYTGTSCVLGIRSGEVRVHGVLGRGEKDLLVVDTKKDPIAKLVAEPPLRGAKPVKPPKKQEMVEVQSPKIIKIPEPDEEEPVKLRDPRLDDVVVIMTPIEPQSPHAFYGWPSKQQQDPPPFSPIYRRPSSPKSRNASRTGVREPKEPDLQNHDLADSAETENHRLAKGPSPVQYSDWALPPSESPKFGRSPRLGRRQSNQSDSLTRSRSSEW